MLMHWARLQAYSQPQAVHNGSVVEVDTEYLGKLRLARPAPIMHGTPLHIPSAAPLYGQHTIAVLRELGWDDAAIGSLHNAGIVRMGQQSKL